MHFSCLFMQIIMTHYHRSWRAYMHARWDVVPGYMTRYIYGHIRLIKWSLFTRFPVAIKGLSWEIWLLLPPSKSSGAASTATIPGWNIFSPVYQEQ